MPVKCLHVQNASLVDLLQIFRAFSRKSGMNVEYVNGLPNQFLPGIPVHPARRRITVQDSPVVVWIDQNDRIW